MAPLDDYVEAWINALMSKNQVVGVRLTDELNTAYDAFDCLSALPALAADPHPVVNIPWACVGVARDVLQEATEKVIETTQ